MPKNKVRKHPPHRQKTLHYDPVYTDGLTDDLRHTLKTKLTLPELIELEKQLRRCVEETAKWAVTLRVLHDRFAFGAGRKKKLYDACLDYLRDIQEGRLTLKEMLDTLEHEDGIRLTWEDDE